MMQTLWKDIRFGFRLLRRSPTYSLIALLTLVLGIGANTLIFSLFNALTFRGPFRNSENVVVIGNQYPEMPFTPASWPDFQAWRQQARSFERLGAVYHVNLNFSGRGEPQRVRGAMVSGEFFGVFGFHPAMGRPFDDNDQHKGSVPVCIISEAMWRELLGSDPAVVKSAVNLDGTSYHIIGVLPEGAPDFRGARKTQVWLPLEANPPFESHGTNFLLVAGKLKPGTSPDEARTDLRSIQSRIDAEFPENKHDIAISSLLDRILGNARPALILLTFTVAFVLLIACANATNMVLARASGRTREIALREALGATRGRLARQLLTENLLLTTLAAVAAVGLSYLAAGSLLRFWPSTLRRPDAIDIDWRVLTFTATVSFISVLMFGLVPALRFSRLNFNRSLREAQGLQVAMARGGSWIRRSFVAGEVALAAILLTTAVLTLRSFVHLVQVDPGFRAEKVLTLNLALPQKKYPQPLGQYQFYDELLRRVRALPGVESAGASSAVPLGNASQTGDFDVQGRVYAPDRRPFAEHYFVTPGYLEVMKIPLLQGRFFTPDDRLNTAKAVVINRAAARQIWPDENPIGKQIKAGLSEGEDWQQVIGVVGDVKGDRLQADARPQLYFSTSQFPVSDMTLVVRSRLEPAMVTRAIKDLLFSIDPEQPVIDVNLMDDVIAESISTTRSAAYLQGLLASLAMVLAVLGIYGVMAYSITQRNHEFSIRMALGAKRGNIMTMVLAGGLRLVAWGTLIGMAGSLVVAYLLRSQLFGISAADPATYLLVTLLLFSGAILASILPAYRATRADPMMMLKHD